MGGATSSTAAASATSQSAILRPGAAWVDDDLFTHCYRCEKEFSPMRRRHHCRMCGAVFCSECCPKTANVDAAIVAKNASMPQTQRDLERICKSCRLPAWMLPMTVLRLPGGSDRGVTTTAGAASRPTPPAAAAERGGSLGPGGNSAARLSKADARKAAKAAQQLAEQWFAKNLVPRADGIVMQTILSFLSVRDRTSVLQAHEAIRQCLPVPPIDTENVFIPIVLADSVGSVYPGVVAVGDGRFAGGFRQGMKGITEAMLSPLGTRPEKGHANARSSATSSRNNQPQHVAHIGSGAEGSVYYAIDRTRSCFVAVKLVSKAFAHVPLCHRYERTFAALEKEVAIHADLDDERIARLHSVFQTRGHVVIVSDAGEGRTARSAAIEVRGHDDAVAAPRRGTQHGHGSPLVREPYPLEHANTPSIVPFTLRVISGVVKALQYMASRGYAHRDIKLDNVILTRDYSNVRLIDFGLAEKFNEEAGNGEGFYVPLGTPSYLSPENIRAVVKHKRRFPASKRTILACDVFSLGVMAYMMLGNKRVYGAANDYNKMLVRAEEGIYCRGEGWERVPASVTNLVQRMLCYRADERPTFEDILADPVFVEYAGDMNVVLEQRYHRVAEAETELHRNWDMVLDANDYSDDDEAFAAASSGYHANSSIITEAAGHSIFRKKPGAAPSNTTTHFEGNFKSPPKADDRTPRQAGVVVVQNFDDEGIVDAVEGDHPSTDDAMHRTTALRYADQSQRMETTAVPLLPTRSQAGSTRR
jgi:serine/threonine protein kinase